MAKAHIFQRIVDKHIEKYNGRYAEFGDDCRALGWPREEDNAKRFEMMWGLWRGRKHRTMVSVLDFGCGLGHFPEWLLGLDQPPGLKYVGLDINQDFVNACYEKYPNMTFLRLDVLDNEEFGTLPSFDYIVCNGVFTEKLDTPYHAQWGYFAAVIQRLWQRTTHGIAFNVMSPVVDYERDDLFYVPFSKMAKFIRYDLDSHNFVFRQDYGLWEYTTYVYR